MTLPEGLPASHPEQSKIPEVVGGGIAEPPLNPNEMRTFRISSPLLTHFTPATCTELNCREFRYGWRVDVQPDTDLGQNQILFIKASGLIYTQWYDDDKETVVFSFGPGQNSWSKHWKRSDLEPEFSTFIGDNRSSGTPDVLTRNEWLVMCGRWVREIKERQLELVSRGRDQVGIRHHRPPIVHAAEEQVGPSGYAVHIGRWDLTRMITDVQVHLPRRAADETKVLSALSLGDAGVTVTGVRDAYERNAMRVIRIMAGERAPLRVTVGSSVVKAMVEMPDPTVVRVGETAMWQAFMRLSEHVS